MKSENNVTAARQKASAALGVNGAGGGVSAEDRQLAPAAIRSVVFIGGGENGEEIININNGINIEII
jgi:hypothetical protein